ncbi:unnamed protein product, partial [Allacma fusca]
KIRSGHADKLHHANTHVCAFVCGCDSKERIGIDTPSRTFKNFNVIGQQQMEHTFPVERPRGSVNRTPSGTSQGSERTDVLVTSRFVLKRRLDTCFTSSFKT